MKAGATIAVLTAVFTLWRAPRRTTPTGADHEIAEPVLELVS